MYKELIKTFLDTRREFNEKWKKNFPLVPPPSPSPSAILSVLKIDYVHLVLIMVTTAILFFLYIKLKHSEAFRGR
jgi:hypothetical protein